MPRLPQPIFLHVWTLRNTRCPVLHRHEWFARLLERRCIVWMQSRHCVEWKTKSAVYASRFLPEVAIRKPFHGSLNFGMHYTAMSNDFAISSCVSRSLSNGGLLLCGTP